jgi:hypothetical protein
VGVIRIVNSSDILAYIYDRGLLTEAFYALRGLTEVSD